MKSLEIIFKNGNNINLSVEYDLYSLYNDFLIDLDYNKKTDIFVEFVRDNYSEIFEKLPNSLYCDLETFETIIKKYIVKDIF